MTDKIERLREKLEIAKDAWQSARFKLDAAMIEQAEADFEAKGIKVGAKVRSGKETGIYDGMSIKYDRVIPVIRKLTKTGKTHASHTIYVWNGDKVELAE
jgi:restriction endonuclease S subunit